MTSHRSSLEFKEKHTSHTHSPFASSHPYPLANRHLTARPTPTIPSTLPPYYALLIPFRTRPTSLSNARNSPTTLASCTTGPSTASTNEDCAVRRVGGTRMPNMRIGSADGGVGVLIAGLVG